VGFAISSRLRQCAVFLATISGLSASLLTGPLLPPASLSFSLRAASTTTVDQMMSDPSLRTHEGRSLEVIQVRVGESRKRTDATPHRFLVQGGLHGNERLTPKFILWLAQRVARGESALNHLPLRGYDIDFLPSANPDGFAANTRANKAGINLNRNFGVLWGVSRENPGSSSFSEPETKAIQALFTKRKYTATVDVHGYIKWIVAPSHPQLIAGESAVSPEKASRYSSWMRTLGQIAEFLGGYKLHTAGGLGDGGAFEDWAFWKADAFSFCLELASSERFANAPTEGSLTPFGALHPIKALRNLTGKLTNGNSADSFLKYEHAIFIAFSEAIAASRSAGEEGEKIITQK